MKTIKQIWLAEFLNKSVCALCGNSGYVDTRGKINVAGTDFGIKTYCICPNGRSIKKQEDRIKYEKTKRYKFCKSR